jgi:predicted MPP superfamily phosphohydrolase
MRRFLRWSLLLVLCLLAYGSFVEPFRLKVTYYGVTTPQWSAPPMRLAVLSDIHCG